MQPTTAFPQPTTLPAQQPRARRFRSWRVILALILRETGSRETRTSLGFLWTLIDPILAVLLLSAAFSVVQRTPRLGTNFPLYYITGVMPFQLFTHVSQKVATSIRYSGNLLGFPSVTVVDVLMSRFLLNVFTNVLVFVVLVVWVVLHYDLRLYPNYYDIGMSLTMAAVLALGIGTMNSVFFLWSPAYETFFSVAMRPMTLFCGVMFPITDLPTPFYNVLKWLPMAHPVAEMRTAFYPAHPSFFISPGYVFTVSAVCFVVGLIGLHRYVFDLLEQR